MTEPNSTQGTAGRAAGPTGGHSAGKDFTAGPGRAARPERRRADLSRRQLILRGVGGLPVAAALSAGRADTGTVFASVASDRAPDSSGPGSSTPGPRAQHQPPGQDTALTREPITEREPLTHGSEDSSRAPLQVRDFGAVGDGRTDDSRAISAALAALTPGATLVFAPGRYLVSSYVNIQGTTGVTILGYGAQIASTDQANPVVVAYGNSGLVLAGLAVTHTSLSNGRSGAGFGIKLASCTATVVRDCRAHHTSSAGILNQDCHQLAILDNTVHDTLADGIHTTGASTRVTVTGNTVIRPGDDGIAVVSYRADGARCAHVTIEGNSVHQGAARGVSVVGGSRVRISRNTITGTRAAGILIAQEAVYATFGAHDITVTDNTITAAATITAGGAVAHAAVLIDCADPHYPIGAVTITGNIVRRPRLSGYVVSGAAGGVQGVTVDANVFTGPSTTPNCAAFAVTAAGDSVQLGRNQVTDSSGDGFLVTGPGRVGLTGNDVRHTPAGSLAYRLSASTRSTDDHSS